MSGMSSVVSPILTGCGPPKNSVTMMPLIVIVFMNSARKNSAKRMLEYSVLNPPTSSCSASTRSNGGRLSSAVAAIMKMTNGTKPVATMCQSMSSSWTATMPVVLSVPAKQQHGRQAEPERRLVADHLRGGPHRAEQRVLRAARPAGEHDAVDRDRRQRQHEQDADRRIGELHPRLVAEPRHDAVVAVAEVAAERDHAPHQERRDEREVRRELEHEPVGALGDQVLLEEQLDAVGQRLEDAERAGLVRADPVLHAGDHLALEPDHQHRGDERRSRRRRRP